VNLLFSQLGATEVQMTRLTIAIAASAALFLSACGTDLSDRTISGAGIGTGAGAAVGAVNGLNR